MIQLSTLMFPGAGAAPRAGSPLASASDFALALADLVGPTGAATAVTGRQPLAGGGSIVPVAVAAVPVMPRGPASQDEDDAAVIALVGGDDAPRDAAAIVAWAALTPPTPLPVPNAVDPAVPPADRTAGIADIGVVPTTPVGRAELRGAIKTFERPDATPAILPPMASPPRRIAEAGDGGLVETAIGRPLISPTRDHDDDVAFAPAVEAVRLDTPGTPDLRAVVAGLSSDAVIAVAGQGAPTPLRHRAAVDPAGQALIPHATDAVSARSVPQANRGHVPIAASTATGITGAPIAVPSPRFPEGNERSTPVTPPTLPASTMASIRPAVTAPAAMQRAAARGASPMPPSAAAPPVMPPATAASMPFPIAPAAQPIMVPTQPGPAQRDAVANTAERMAARRAFSTDPLPVLTTNVAHDVVAPRVETAGRPSSALATFVALSGVRQAAEPAGDETADAISSVGSIPLAGVAERAAAAPPAPPSPDRPVSVTVLPAVATERPTPPATPNYAADRVSIAEVLPRAIAPAAPTADRPSPLAGPRPNDAAMPTATISAAPAPAAANSLASLTPASAVAPTPAVSPATPPAAAPALSPATAPPAPAIAAIPVAAPLPPVAAVSVTRQAGDATSSLAVPVQAPRPESLRGARGERPVGVSTPARATAKAPPLAQPAAQAFAAAMFVAERPAPEARIEMPADAPAAAVLTAGSVPTTTAAATPATDPRPPLDLARDDWMGTMIERIETLRTDGGMREARLRLTPDALGTVDVSIRQDADGSVRIHVAAESPQARAILAEAAPRLSELAEQRGLRLGGGSPDTGGGDAGRREAERSDAPRAPLPADPADDDPDAHTDTRIA